METRVSPSMHAVFANCKNSAKPGLADDFKPDVVLVYESGQGSEPDVLNPVAVNKDPVASVVLSGDHKQLYPVAINKDNNEFAQQMALSLFRRLAETPNPFPLFLLDVQYRVHPRLSEWSDRMICRSLLQDDPSTQGSPQSSISYLL